MDVPCERRQILQNIEHQINGQCPAKTEKETIQGCPQKRFPEFLSTLAAIFARHNGTKQGRKYKESAYAGDGIANEVCGRDLAQEREKGRKGKSDDGDRQNGVNHGLC